MKPFYVLAAKLNIPIVFEEEWKERTRLVDRGYRLIDEGKKLVSRGSDKGFTQGIELIEVGRKMRAEGMDLYIRKAIKELGGQAKIDWENGEVTL